MPRTQNRRSQALKRIWAERRTSGYVPQHPAKRRGTGCCHTGGRWPISVMTGRCHKLVIPAKAPDKKFVLLVGDSHLRPIASGFAKMPEENLIFGVMCTLGATAQDLRIEVVNASLPWTPDAVCLVAPSDNLTARRTISEAGADFGMLLASACSRWPNVVVVDFPTRLDIEMVKQKSLRQEFHRVAAHMGVNYMSGDKLFPLDRLELWSKNGIHLSDNEGMQILCQLLWTAAHKQLKTAAPTSVTSSHLEVAVNKEAEIHPIQPNHSAGTAGCQDKKRNQPVELEQSCGVVPKRRKFQQQDLKECSIQLTPLWFSSARVDSMRRVVPSHPSSPVECPDDPKGKGVEAVLNVVEVLPTAVGEEGFCLRRSARLAMTEIGPAMATSSNMPLTGDDGPSTVHEYQDIPEENIQKMQQVCIDSSVAGEVDDPTMAAYIPPYGDRITTRRSCMERQRCGDNQQRLYSFERGEDFEELSMQATKPCDKRNLDMTRKIELGWIHDKRQVREASGGGTRVLHICKTATKIDILLHAKQLFFPDETSSKGKWEEFRHDIVDFQKAHLDKNVTVGELYETHKSGTLMFYLFTEHLTIDEVFTGMLEEAENDEELTQETEDGEQQTYTIEYDQQSMTSMSDFVSTAVKIIDVRSLCDAPELIFGPLEDELFLDDLDDKHQDLDLNL